LFFVIRRCYFATLPVSTRFPLTAPSQALSIDEKSINPVCLGFKTAFTIKRRTNETKIVLGNLKPEPDQTLLSVLTNARFWLNELRLGKSLVDIAKEAQIDLSILRKSIRLGLLSPALQKAILTGQHPDNWSVSLFTRNKMPLEWKKQEEQYLA
jgi:hypothetical protein